MKFILSLTTIPVVWLASLAAQAQTTAPAPTPVDLGNTSSPIPQPRGISNTNSSSEQFFQRGRDKLYFLEESEPVLEIDEDIPSEAENSAEIENNQPESTESEQSK